MPVTPDTPPPAYEIQVEQRYTEPLFFLCGVGEANALFPVMLKLKERGVDFRVLLASTATHLVSPGLFPGRVHTIDPTKVNLILGKEGPQLALQLQTLNEIRERFLPKMIITGTSNLAEEQILEIFPDVKKIAYAEKFTYEADSEEFDLVKRIAKLATRSIAATNLTKSALLDSEESLNIDVMGQPAIEAWLEQMAQIKSAPIRQAMIRLALKLENPEEPIVSIVLGSSDPPEVLELFLAMEKTLKEKGYNVNMQPHPKIGQPKVPFYEAAAVSDYIISFNSTAGFLSLFLHKKVIFAVPEGVKYTNFAIEQGFGPKISTGKELLSAIRMMELRPTDDLQQKLGMPHKSSEAIATLIEEELK